MSQPLKNTHRRDALKTWDQIPPERQSRLASGARMGWVLVLVGLALVGVGCVLLFTDDEPAKWFLLLVGAGVGLLLWGSNMASRQATKAGGKFLTGFLKDVAEAWKARK